MVCLTENEVRVALVFLNRVETKGVKEAKLLAHLADRLTEKEVEQDATQQQPETAGDDTE